MYMIWPQIYTTVEVQCNSVGYISYVESWFTIYIKRSISVHLSDHGILY